MKKYTEHKIGQIFFLNVTETTTNLTRTAHLMLWELLQMPFLVFVKLFDVGG